jgi:hypothetical protein
MVKKSRILPVLALALANIIVGCVNDTPARQDTDHTPSASSNYPEYAGKYHINCKKTWNSGIKRDIPNSEGKIFFESEPDFPPQGEYYWCEIRRFCDDGSVCDQVKQRYYELQ